MAFPTKPVCLQSLYYQALPQQPDELQTASKSFSFVAVCDVSKELTWPLLINFFFDTGERMMQKYFWAHPFFQTDLACPFSLAFSAPWDPRVPFYGSQVAVVIKLAAGPKQAVWLSDSCNQCTRKKTKNRYIGKLQLRMKMFGELFTKSIGWRASDLIWGLKNSVPLTMNICSI